jgi:IS5 family transposase
MVETIKKNTGGAKPAKLSADTGYFSQLNMEYLEEEGIDAYVATGRETYSKRKEIVESVFSQIKECRGFRRFLLRGLENVTAEWELICLTHNLLKIFRSGLMPKGA